MSHACRIGHFGEAVRLYSQGIGENPNIFAYEKRCSALAHMGKYKEALADAHAILTMEPSMAKARLRVKVIIPATRNHCMRNISLALQEQLQLTATASIVVQFA